MAARHAHPGQPVEAEGDERRAAGCWLRTVQNHRLDLTDALGAPLMPMPQTTTMAAEVLDEVPARRAVPGRPADLEGDDLAFIRAAAGRATTPIHACRSWDNQHGQDLAGGGRASPDGMPTDLLTSPAATRRHGPA